EETRRHVDEEDRADHVRDLDERGDTREDPEYQHRAADEVRERGVLHQGLATEDQVSSPELGGVRRSQVQDTEALHEERDAEPDPHEVEPHVAIELTPPDGAFDGVEHDRAGCIARAATESSTTGAAR